MAKAFDAAGNNNSDSISVNVNNSDTTPPAVTTTSPTGGSTVSGLVAVNANASDNVGVSRVEFYVDGVLKGTDTTSPYGYSWNSASSSNGNHSVMSKAFDPAGNNSNDSVSVSVNNADTAPPTVSITSPANGAAVSGTVAVSASASDNIGVSRVEFYVDGVLKGTDTTSPYSYSWDTTTASNGSHTVMAKAFDAAGNNNSHSISVTVSNATPLSITSSGASNITPSEGTISWTTNLPSTGTVFYGTSSSSMTLSVSSSVLGTSHSVILTGLKSKTNYYYKVVATDGTTTATSATASFKTAAGSGGGRRPRK
jgi:uncharacterized protein involved in tellurium resistance